MKDGGGEQRHRRGPAEPVGQDEVGRHHAQDIGFDAPPWLAGGRARPPTRRRRPRTDRASSRLLQDRRGGGRPSSRARRSKVAAPRRAGRAPRSRQARWRRPAGPWIVSRPAPVGGAGEVVGVAQGGLVLAQAQEPRRGGSGGERLAHAQGAEPGRVGAHDLVERGQGRAGRKGAVDGTLARGSGRRAEPAANSGGWMRRARSERAWRAGLRRVREPGRGGRDSPAQHIRRRRFVTRTNARSAAAVGRLPCPIRLPYRTWSRYPCQHPMSLAGTRRTAF